MELIWGGECRGSVPLAWGGREGRVLSKVVLCRSDSLCRRHLMASSAVLGCVLAALLEDYDIYDELTLATLIVDGDVAADIARRLRHDDFAAKLCAAKAIARGIELHRPYAYANACVATSSCTTRDVGSMATYLASGERGVSTASQAVVRVAQCASQANVAASSVVDAAVSAGVNTADAQTTTNGLVTTADVSTDHYLVLGLGLKEGAAQTTFDVTSLEETLASTLSALDSSQAAQLALEQRVAELERQLEQHSADAEKQADLAVATLEETLASTRSALRAAEERATMLTKILDQRVQNETLPPLPPPRPPPPRPPPPRPPPPRPPPPCPPPSRPPPPPPPHSQPPLPHNQPALPPPPPSSSSPQPHAHPPLLYPASQSEA